jgi:hypothetical protein
MRAAHGSRAGSRSASRVLPGLSHWQLALTGQAHRPLGSAS